MKRTNYAGNITEEYLIKEKSLELEKNFNVIKDVGNIGIIRFEKGNYYYSPEILNMLMNYSWPGNIRELKNMVEHLVVFSKNNEIQIDTLPEYINNKEDKTISIKNEKSLTDLIRKTEIKAIHDAMKECGNNKQQAAKLLDIPRSTLYYKIKFYDLNQYL